MRLRDGIEALLRGWNQYEIARGAKPVIDYDCYPAASDAIEVSSRLAAYQQFDEMRDAAQRAGDQRSLTQIDAHRAYLCELMGARAPFSVYIRATQACGSAGWPDEYVTRLGEIARVHLECQGVGWGPRTETELEDHEGSVEAADAGDEIRRAAAELEPSVRAATGTAASYELAVEMTESDEYWSYWLDGSGHHARLRLNLKNARFTTVRIRQFALHEILGHALQYASLAAQCENGDVPWVRLLSVHAPQQVLFEGLAQALPLFIAPTDSALMTRVHLDRYLQLVRAEVHGGLNEGASVEECAAHARGRVPFWDDASIADAMSDRGADPLLRSYLWAYPAGFDWFAALASAPATVAQEVLHATYREPLTSGQLAGLWPAGPPIGGPGGAVRLRQPAVP